METMQDTASRYAIYYAPPRDSALGEFGDTWLGRCGNGRTRPRTCLPCLDRDELDTATRGPSRYGFHGTLKAPFRLREGVSETDLMQGAVDFARSHAPVHAPPLELTAIGSFLALAPRGEAPDLERLAACCVLFFDIYRRPPDGAELERRRAQGLTDRQEELLLRFGYPFVLEEFRFHLTLTGQVRDQALRDRLLEALTPLVRPFERVPLEINDICVFQQAEPESRFRLVRRFPLLGEKRP